jgi:hypothetical protein
MSSLHLYSLCPSQAGITPRWLISSLAVRRDN